ncbi:hypothetical protein RB595_007055 [Gaeumannomyces hyphopodioides]
MDNGAASRIAKTSKDAAWVERARKAAEKNEAERKAEEDKRKREETQGGDGKST